MKIVTLLSIGAALLMPSLARAQLCFNEVPIDPDIDAPLDAIVADLDGDGDLDAISGVLNLGAVFWHRSSGGPNPIFDTFPVDDSDIPITSVFAADLDGDGDTDILAAAGDGTDAVFWYENAGAQTTPWFRRAIDESRLDAKTVRAADLDADGDTDVIATFFGSDQIVWYENDGALIPTFTPRPIPAVITNAWGVFPADLDADGDLDLVSSSEGDDSIYWHQNDGMTPPGFSTVLVTDQALSARLVFAADVNDDGHTDLLAASNDDDTIAWYENNGALSPTFTEHILTTTAERATAVHAADIDADGDTDILFTGRGDNTVGWFESDGVPATPTFTERLITTRAEGAQTIVDADIDGDGDLDIIVAEGVSDRIMWYEHAQVVNTTSGAEFNLLAPAIADAAPGDTLLAEPGHFDTDCAPILDLLGKPITIISTGDLIRQRLTQTVLPDGSLLQAAPGAPALLAGPLSLPAGASAALDADDLVVSGDLSLGAGATLESLQGMTILGQPGFTSRTVSAAEPAATGVAIADLDNDGDLDVVSTNEGDNTTAWHENLGGSPIAFTRRDITIAAGSPRSPVIADIDNDGDPDIAIVAANRVVWYENDGAPTPAFTEIILTELNLPGASTVIAIDFDGDTVLDLLAAAENNDQIALYTNDGAPDPSFAGAIISNAPDAPRGLAAADLDADGDIDLVTASVNSEEIAWLENDGATPPAFTETVLITGAVRADDVEAIDLDQDGDLDILVAIDLSNTIAWLENNGAPDPTFTRRDIATDAARAMDVTTADIDLDGDLDVIAASFTDDTLAYFENDGASPPSFSRRVVSTDQNEVLAVAVGDLDNDGDPDLVSAALAQGAVAWFENILDTDLALTSANTSLGAIGDLTLENKAIDLAGSTALSSLASVNIDSNSTVSGAGEISAVRTRSAGDLVPEPQQSLAVTGVYEQAYTDPALGLGTGRLRVRIDETNPPSRLDVSDAAVLSGALIVTAPPGFNPDPGDEFLVLTAGLPIGADRFEVAFLPGLPDNKFLRVVYNDESIGGGSQPGPTPGAVRVVVDVLDIDISLDPEASTSLDALPTDAALGDLNNDGLPDLVVCIPDPAAPDTAPGSLFVFFNAGLIPGDKIGQFTWGGFSAGAQQLATGVNPSAVAIGQIDGLFGPDVAVASKAEGNLAFYLDDGKAIAFDRTVPFNLNPVDFELVDLDNDGTLDFCVAGEDANGDGLVTWALNTAGGGGGDGGDGGGAGGWGGPGPTGDTSTGGRSRSFDCGDLDDDTDTDFANALDNGMVQIISNASSGPDNSFDGLVSGSAFFVGAQPIDIEIEDLNMDGQNDIVTSNMGDDSVSIILADPASGAFRPAISIPTPENPRAIVVTDLDADSDPDLAIVTDDADGGRQVVTIRNDLDGAQLSFAIADQITNVGNPVLLLADDVDGMNGDDLIAVGENSSPGGAVPPGAGPGAPNDAVSSLLNLGQPCSGADLAPPLGVLDITDVLAFLDRFLAADPATDLAPPTGIINFNDIIAFLNLFASGCP